MLPNQGIGFSLHNGHRRRSLGGVADIRITFGRCSDTHSVARSDAVCETTYVVGPICLDDRNGTS